MSEDIENIEQKTSHIGNYLVYGFIAGMLFGIVLFRNVALGAGFGMCIGVVIGALKDLREKRSSERLNSSLE